MNHKTCILLISAFVTFFFNACEKDRYGLENNFILTSEDLTVQQNFLDANEQEITEQIETGLVSMTSRSFPTRSWTFPKGVYPNTLTIDYGPSGVKDVANRIRKGKMIIFISAPIKNKGSIREVTHENFYIDDVKIEGKVILENKGQNNLGQNEFLRTVINRKLVFPSNKSINWNANQIITQLEGNATPEILIDDVWSILSASAGTNRNGTNFTVINTKKLIYKFTCPWIVEGVISLTLDTKTLSVDYGNGLCDNKVLITLPDGSTYDAFIRRWW